jgi:hypothetical protein
VAAETKDKLDLLMAADDEGEIDTEIGDAIKSLWKDPGVLLAWKRRAEFQIVESVKYYFNEIERIMQDDYVATQQDMLLARVRTSGIVTEKYVIDGKDFEGREEPSAASLNCRYYQNGLPSVEDIKAKIQRLK